MRRESLVLRTKTKQPIMEDTGCLACLVSSHPAGIAAWIKTWDDLAGQKYLVGAWIRIHYQIALDRRTFDSEWLKCKCIYFWPNGSLGDLNIWESTAVSGWGSWRIKHQCLCSEHHCLPFPGAPRLVDVLAQATLIQENRYSEQSPHVTNVLLDLNREEMGWNGLCTTLIAWRWEPLSPPDSERFQCIMSSEADTKA